MAGSRRKIGNGIIDLEVPIVIGVGINFAIGSLAAALRRADLIIRYGRRLRVPIFLTTIHVRTASFHLLSLVVAHPVFRPLTPTLARNLPAKAFDETTLHLHHHLRNDIVDLLSTPTTSWTVDIHRTGEAVFQDAVEVAGGLLPGHDEEGNAARPEAALCPHTRDARGRQSAEESHTLILLDAHTARPSKTSPRANAATAHYPVILLNLWLRDTPETHIGTQ
ncbi:uncharacterized protein BO95DRAFT_461026 [Aspergillus brunneoviolaceus CBS 621.78]|uniref:Uncharacterized protein n=1 Tax=Aspergillus brunneoviolaceus CBS 621.78 TaxID=1450534 RepID=A0ACD1GGJ3_9EURO|nr:hypothetical protein BO95DRAFT_461026 [Aspergillus brunneoviolaceus CBS 621.78]RAH48434.1 hypothetical protein BO95DRAFT_461026 [Aspergillus brunneoviolaceus CBS 621.78]